MSVSLALALGGLFTAFVAGVVSFLQYRANVRAKHADQEINLIKVGQEFMDSSLKRSEGERVALQTRMQARIDLLEEQIEEDRSTCEAQIALLRAEVAQLKGQR